MDQASLDLEFFDFKNATEEEIREIQAILAGSASNGCVELPWQESAEAAIAGISTTRINSPSSPLSSSARTIAPEVYSNEPIAHSTIPLGIISAPAANTYTTLPTTIGHYPNAPYFVPRTVPYVRPYPQVGIPFFACSVPGTSEASAMQPPFAHFLPMVPTNVAPRPPGADSALMEAEKREKSGQGVNGNDGNLMPNSGVCSPAEASHPSPVPIVPLPVPQSAFSVGGSALPLHGYPPGLHTLPYANAAHAHPQAMYYVPVFNHPFSGYLPPANPVMVPANLQPRELSGRDVLATPDLNNQDNESRSAPVETSDAKSPLESGTPHNGKSDSGGSSTPLPAECAMDVAEDCVESQAAVEESTADDMASTEKSKRWADLFSGPIPQVNGIGQPPQMRQGKHNKIVRDIVNGKLSTVPDNK